MKTHGQVLMQKLDKGIDIFDGLEEYLKDPAAFGKPSDQEILEMKASASVLEKMPRSKITKRQKEKESAPKTVDRTKWIKLSHMVGTHNSVVHRIREHIKVPRKYYLLTLLLSHLAGSHQ